MNLEQKKRRERFWARELRDLNFMKVCEYEWIDDGIEPSIDDEVQRTYQGWRLGGYKGLRHWVGEKQLKRIPIEDNKAVVPAGCKILRCEVDEFGHSVLVECPKPRIRVKAGRREISLSDYLLTLLTA